MNNFLGKNILGIILLAALLRLLIMPFYFHPDIKTYSFQVSFLGNGVLNIYSYLSENKAKLPLKEEFVYFPLTYYFLGAYQIIVSPLLGSNFYSWLYNAGGSLTDEIGTFRYLFLLKLPYLFLDILVGLIITLFFVEKKQKELALKLWLFNPFSLILIYVYSNIDIMPVTLTVLSLLFAKNNKLVLSALCLGLGAAFKAYPLLFLPTLFLYANGIKEKLTVTAVTFVSLFLILAPFLTTESFKQSTLVSGLTTRILLPVVGLGFNESIIISILPLAVIFFYAFLKGNLNNKYLEAYFIAVLMILYSFIHYHIQWLLWVIPFLVIFIVKKSENISGIARQFNILVFIALSVALSIPLLYNDSAMSFSLLRPVSLWFPLLTTPFIITSKFYDPYILQSIMHTLFAAISLVLIWELVRQQEQ